MGPPPALLPGGTRGCGARLPRRALLESAVRHRRLRGRRAASRRQEEVRRLAGSDGMVRPEAAQGASAHRQGHAGQELELRWTSVSEVGVVRMFVWYISFNRFNLNYLL